MHGEERTQVPALEYDIRDFGAPTDTLLLGFAATRAEIGQCLRGQECENFGG